MFYFRSNFIFKVGYPKYIFCEAKLYSADAMKLQQLREFLTGTIFLEAVLHPIILTYHKSTN